MAARKRTVSLKHVAETAGFDEAYVRDVLRETPGIQIPKGDADKIFKTARAMGYDFRKLKIGKRMLYRRETLEEVIGRVEEKREWSREEILKYLRESLALVDRVHKRVFRDEFGGK